MGDGLERALDPRIAPRRILRRHPDNDEPTDLAQDTAPTGSPDLLMYVHFWAINWAMPPQQHIRRRDRGDLPQSRTADSERSGSQPTAIVVRDTQPTSTKLPPQEPVLFDQARDGVPLPAIQPAGQDTQHHVQRRGVDHEPELISRASLDRRRPRSGTLRGSAKDLRLCYVTLAIKIPRAKAEP
jgi:hypothetical protein